MATIKTFGITLLFNRIVTITNPFWDKTQKNETRCYQLIFDLHIISRQNATQIPLMSCHLRPTPYLPSTNSNQKAAPITSMKCNYLSVVIYYYYYYYYLWLYSPAQAVASSGSAAQRRL
jgi:hypothetical protein